MDLYLDIDGVLLDYNTDTYAKGAIELIEYITSEFDCYWLTTHCKGGIFERCLATFRYGMERKEIGCILLTNSVL